MSNNKDYIFVYGLFRDQAKNLLGDAKLILRDTVNGKIWKVNEFYPGFVSGESGKVFGDVFQIDNSVLPDLDEYEGHEYDRKRIITDSGIECWIYEYKYDVSEFLWIKSGDWYLR